MAHRARTPEFWAALVAESRSGGLPHTELAAKHGVTTASLKYHLYKKSGSAARAARPPTVLPLRVSGAEARLFELELAGGVRLRFAEGCDPSYVAAVVSKLR